MTMDQHNDKQETREYLRRSALGNFLGRDTRGHGSHLSSASSSGRGRLIPMHRRYNRYQKAQAHQTNQALGNEENVDNVWGQS